MKKQVVFIHGGSSYSDHDQFLLHLKTRKIEDPFGEAIEPKKWKYTIREELASTHEVAYPQMPNSNNSKYLEWKIWFLRHLDLARDGVLLVGWSQGAYFLLKYLSENEAPLKIGGLFLIAPPFETDTFPTEGAVEDGGDFGFDPEKLPNVERQVEHIFIYHSKDDAVVPYTHGVKLSGKLPKATFRTFENRDHFFNEETFPELIADIKSL